MISEKSFFNANVGCSVILIGGILIFIRPVMTIYAGESYFEAWKIVPVLLIASFFSNLSSFYGTIYLAAKKNGWYYENNDLWYAC